MLKCTLSGFQCCCWQCRSIFICLVVVASEICKITLSSPKILTYSSSRSSKVIDLGVNRKLICNFLLVINSNYRRVSYRFRDIDAFSSKIATVWVKKIPPAVFWNFFPNGWEFLINFLHTYYTIISTLEYKLLFKYPQVWQSYAILSATT